MSYSKSQFYSKEAPSSKRRVAIDEECDEGSEEESIGDSEPSDGESLGSQDSYSDEELNSEDEEGIFEFEEDARTKTR